MKKLFFLFFFIVFNLTGFAQNRIKQSVNTDWQFHKGDLSGFPGNDLKDDLNWEKISLPHTWNVTDVMDDEPGYYRGTGWYKKSLYIDPSWKGKEIYLYFEGANQVTDVYVNGKHVGNHIGGYTAFSFPISDYLIFNNSDSLINEIEVKVDNSHNENIPPLSADFTFYGGIYRDVYLIASNPVHFDLDNYASKGIFITTPSVSADKAEVVLQGSVVNHASKAKKLTVISRILNADGKTIAQEKSQLKANANEKRSFKQNFKNISHPELWSPDKPYLYRVVSTIYETAGNKQLDEASNPLGFRWFSFDADKGFFLNGKSCKLIGANRHQDYKDMGNALPDELNIQDMQLLKNMGGNFIRISHYPQDPSVLEACDRLGILASVEIPIVNRITETNAFSENCRRMQREMIRQNFNHPAVIIWAYMNEVLISPRYVDNSSERKTYFDHVVKLAQELDDLTHKEDPYRYTMISCHGDFDRYYKTGMTKVPQIIGWNLYPGWYSPSLSGLSTFLERHHRELPDKPMIVTEYGADADIRLHDFSPLRFDKTMEYAMLYHRFYLREIMKRPFVAGAAAWNLVEFNSEGRAEAVPHINNKGLLTADRKPKNTYWYYQSQLLKTPFIKIGAASWKLRSGIAEFDEKPQCVQPVEIYTNAESVTVGLNGKNLGSVPVDSGIARINVSFINGINKLETTAEVNGKKIADVANIRFLLIPQNLKSEKLPFKEIHVSLGDQRYFEDEKLQKVWLPEKEYSSGSWGYIGGEVFKMKGNDRLPYGSEKNILGTGYDAIYETQRTGIKQFKLDVPDGDYEITLHFAELLNGRQTKGLVYNLDKNRGVSSSEERDFDVLINEQIMIPHLGSANYLKPAQAFSSRFNIIVRDGKGITVSFTPYKGDAILNAIEVKKIM